MILNGMTMTTTGQTMNIPSHNTRRLNYICLTAALGGLLFGFDTAVISGTITLLKAQFNFNSGMEGWLVSSGLLGSIAGVVTAGVLSDRIGRKKAIMLSGVMFLLSGIGCAVAGNFTLLIVARILGGVGVGMASVISPMFIAEFAPAASRGRMIAYYQLAITLGILLAYFSNAVFQSFAQQRYANVGLSWFFNLEPWRPMFLAMAAPSLIFLLMLLRIPESPRWLVSIGQSGKASAILNTLKTNEEASAELNQIQTAAVKARSEKISLTDKSLRLPLLIGILLAVFQQFSGINAIIYYGPSIFKAAGINTSNALVFQVIIGLVNLVFTVVAIKWADRYGRKFLLKTGLAGIILSLIFTGLLFWFNYTQGLMLLVLMLFYIACFAFSLGPVTWIIINEIFPTTVRVKAVSVCTLALWIAVWMVGQFFPWLLEVVGPAFTFWLFAAFSLMNLVFCEKVVRETSGKTLEQMGEVFLSPH